MVRVDTNGLLRLMEDKACPDYEKCLKDCIKKNKKYCPCYFCNGGKSLEVTLHCPLCKTMWIEDNNENIINRISTCPFCKTRFELQNPTLRKDKIEFSLRRLYGKKIR